MVDGLTITAVLFVYNEELFIANQLDSLFAQSCEIDKVLIVDDQSTDGSKQIIDEYSKTYRNIRYLWNNKKGKANAYAAGIGAVDTELFFICAGDDHLFKEYVEYLYFNLLKKNNLFHCYARYTIANEKLEPQSEIRRKRYYDDEEILYRNFLSGYLFGRKEIISHILPLPENLEFEDWYTAIKLTQKYGKSYISDKALFTYRRHNRSATSTLGSKSKYFSLLHRDLKFLNLVRTTLPLSLKGKKIIEDRMIYFEALLEYNFLTSLKLFFNPHIRWFEKLKLFIFPFFVKSKYQ